MLGSQLALQTINFVFFMRLLIGKRRFLLENAILFALVSWEVKIGVGMRAEFVMHLYGSHLCIFDGRFVETGIRVRTKFVFEKPAG